eukprot:TRINITY_DN20215_c0_g2_i2.p1 TRINITY_DN20215_c0_g2~~TRINITY_DN20215_c0_g2_i2.p1  ORF type:complete len:212 (-),score=12.05 TRINITY_DN20215_c0_g2_i2:61-696(-)
MAVSLSRGGLVAVLVMALVGLVFQLQSSNGSETRPLPAHRPAVTPRSSTRRSPSQNTRASEVMVVDEHMHVLPHWFKLAQKSSPLGATLVHIDGHSDMAPPSNSPKWPRHDADLAKMRGACENDEFVLYSLLLGQISNIVFIAPTWTHDANSISTQEFSVGLTGSGTPCLCWADKRKCESNDASIRRDQCFVTRTGQYLSLIHISEPTRPY